MRTYTIERCGVNGAGETMYQVTMRDGETVIRTRGLRKDSAERVYRACVLSRPGA